MAFRHVAKSYKPCGKLKFSYRRRALFSQQPSRFLWAYRLTGRRLTDLRADGLTAETLRAYGLTGSRVTGLWAETLRAYGFRSGSH